MNTDLIDMPHVSNNRRIMLDVLVALIPPSLAAVVFFGFKAIGIILTCVTCAVLAEFIFNITVKKKQTIGDCSAIVTGLILALNLNTNVALWQCAIGAVFAIIIVKAFFGGFGKNIVNPAVASYVFLLLSFASVSSGAAISPIFDLKVLGDLIPEIAVDATPLSYLSEGVAAVSKAPSLLQLVVGGHSGAIGETCVIALLIGYSYLVVRKVIKWYVPATFVATVFVCYMIFTGDAVYSLLQILSGGLIIGAVFMATDYVTTPITNFGKVIFCACCGIITFVIRKFGFYTEGVTIAILTMNLLTPFINDIKIKKAKEV